MIKFPKTVKIGGYKIPVKFISDFKEEPDLLGLCNQNALIITINKYINRSTKRSNHSLCETLIHESLHAVDKVYTNDTLEENTVWKLSRFLYCILAYNDLKLNNIEIPKYIDIIGEIFLVKYPYIFKDTRLDFVYRTDLETSEFRIADSAGSISIDNQKIKSSMIYSILSYLTTADYFDDSEFKDIELTSLSEGIYQFLKDNHINKLVRRCYNERIMY